MPETCEDRPCERDVSLTGEGRDAPSNGSATTARRCPVVGCATRYAVVRGEHKLAVHIAQRVGLSDLNDLTFPSL